MFDKLQHDFFVFANAEAAECDAVEVHFCDCFCALFAKVFVDCPLGDAKEKLFGIVVCFNAACCPEVGAFDSVRHRFVILVGVGNMVEGHGDVAADGAFDFHYFLWCEEFIFFGIRVVEGDAFVVDAEEEFWAEDLEAAAVGEDAAVPMHEVVESFEFFYDGQPRSEIEEECVGDEHIRS